MNTREHRPRGLEGRWKRKKGKKKNRQTWSDLWVSFQQSRLAPLSSPEHKSWKRCATQKHNSGFLLLCNDWWNNVSQELLCPSCRSFPLYCHSRPLHSFSFSCLLSCVFLPVSLALAPFDSASLFGCAAPLSWCHSEGKCHTEREVFRHSAPLFFRQAWTAWFPKPCLSLHCHSINFKVLWVQVSCINCEAVIFLSYFAFSHLESVTFLPYPSCLYYKPVLLSHLFSSPFSFPVQVLSLLLALYLLSASLQLLLSYYPQIWFSNPSLWGEKSAHLLFVKRWILELFMAGNCFARVKYPCVCGVWRLEMPVCWYANEGQYVNECPNLDVNHSVRLIIICLMRRKVEEWNLEGLL